jgi:3-oxoacyl-[acyl-carrier protein] reductase
VKLIGKTALVTGGGRGIGRAIAVAFAQAGADVCIVARTREEIEAVADEIRSAGRRAISVECDVRDGTAAAHAVDATVSELGSIDVLINNAGSGVGASGAVGEDDPDDWENVFRTYLLGSYFFARAAVQPMRDRGCGHIINIGSGMGHQPTTGSSAYNTAKAALWMLTQCLALELRGYGILVNELIPGPVDTGQVLRKAFETGQTPSHFEGEWLKQPEDVAPLAVFLASQPPTGPTGQSFSLARRPM